ncbi:hypothetical protein D3C71_1211170 [compost metagenome]
MVQLQATVIRNFTDLAADYTPAIKNLLRLSFILRFYYEQHPFLRFRKHHFIRGHAVFTLWHLIKIQLQTVARFTCHLGTRAGKSSRTHILNPNNDAAVD